MTSSRRWMKEHVTDPYVLKAKQDGLRARAAYKLLEINEKEKILRPGMLVVDLGAAPGSWSVYAAEQVGRKGEIIALDILPMDEIDGVSFIQGDFTKDEVFESLLQMIDGRPVDLVLSDMAPNLSGVKSIDQPKSMYLVELALDIAQKILCPGGNFLTKAFQGSGIEELVSDARQHFKQIKHLKPDASRSRSREVYILAKGFK